MKTKLSLLFASALAASTASGALITLNNGGGAGAFGIQTTEGHTFRNGTVAGEAFAAGGGISAGAGVVAFGVFSTDDLTGATTPSELIGLFTQFGGTVAFNQAGPVGNRSVFSSAQNVTVTGSDFAGKVIYLLAGNGSTLEGSSQFLVLKSTLAFNTVSDDTPTPTVLTISPANSSVLIGSAVANVQTTNTDTTTTAGWEMAVIPEPSTALLGLLGLAGMMRRKR